METTRFEIVFQRIKTITKTYQDTDLAGFLGITPQAIASAKKKKRVPRTWFETILEKTGTTREELCRPTTTVTSSLVQNWGNAIDADGCYNVSINQTGAGPPGDGITLTVSEREAHLIELLRMYASSAMWARIKTELQQEAKKYQ